MLLKQLNPAVRPVVLPKVNHCFLRYTMVLVRRFLSFQVTSLTRLWPALPKRSPASLLPYSIQLSHPRIMAHWNHQYPRLTSFHTILQLWLKFNRYPWHQHNTFHLSPLEVPVCSLGAAAVSSSVNHIHNNLTGELYPPSDLPLSLFLLSALPVDGMSQKKKIKTKICANEYIDFGSLVVNPLFENKYQVTFQNPQGGLTPSLSLESVAKPKRINSIGVWDFHPEIPS